MNIRPFKGFAMPLALVMSLAGSSVAFAQATSESDDSSEMEEITLEKFEVTGSRIARLDAETPNPVVSMSAGNIETMGFPTLADAVRALPFNSGQALTPTDAGTSFTPGVSSFNLRGLGNNSTLVLVNGRRAVPYAAPGFDGNQTVFDLNSIPESAIDSVDILKDGGSALYGSDAIAGVVNFRMKKNYVGAETSFEVGDYFDTGGMLKRASISVGTVGAKTSMFTSLSWMEQDSVFSRDLPWSENADKTDLADGYGRYEVNDGGLEAAGFDSVDDYVAGIGFTNPTADGWWDNRSSRGFPGYLTSSAGRVTFAQPTDNPTLGNATGATNFYNYNETNGLLPEVERFNLFTTLDHEITEHVSLFAELSYVRSDAVTFAAATPVDIESSRGFDQTDPLTYPDYNPFNPTGENITNGRRRLIELPNRISDVSSDTPRFVAGLRGDFEQIGGFFEEWNWETAVMYSKNTVQNISRNAAVDSRLQEAFNGLTRLGDGSFEWNPATPRSDRVYFNWFGNNEAAFGDYISTNNPEVSELEYRMLDFRIDGPLIDFPGGQVGFAFGGEHRAEEMSNVRTDLNATANILGGSEGTGFAGSRDLTAFYGEVSLPFHEKVEVQVAGRYEAYSDDGFEEKIRPKVAGMFRPFDWMILRASFAESFKAPDLSYLYSAGLTTFSSNQVVDPVTSQVIDQIQVKGGGDPNLQPETTDTFYAGVSFEPTGVLEGLSVSVDWFRFDQTNMLAQLSDVFSFAEFLQEEFNGNPTFEGKVTRDPTTNEVLFISDNYANISESEYTGYDFEVRYDWDTNSMGRFSAGLAATYLDSYSVDGSEQVGGYLVAEVNGNASINWAYKDWNVNAFAVYRGERTRSLSFGNIYTANDQLFLVYDVEAQTVLNLSATYHGFEKTKITLGINNVLNENPPLDGFDPLGTTPGVNDALPAYWYMRVTREF
jgi:iron complex outermembrane recepter protein